MSLPAQKDRGLTAGNEEQGITQMDHGEFPHVSQVDQMGQNAHDAEFEAKAIDYAQECLEPNNRIYHARQETFCDHGVLFDELGEIV